MLIQEGNLESLYDRILDAAVNLMSSDMASMQLGLGDADRQAPRHETGDLSRWRDGWRLHRIWVDGTEFRWTREAAAT